MLRLDGVTFREMTYGVAHAKGGALGDAEQSSCDDIGRHARGAYSLTMLGFVRTWAVRGRDPAEVIATVESDESLAYYVADNLSERRRERLTSELGAGG